MGHGRSRRQLLRYVGLTGVLPIGIASGRYAHRLPAVNPDGDGGSDEYVTEVIVAPDGTWVFEPETVEIGQGETVEWYFESPGHNVTSHPDASGRNENPSGAEPFASYEGDDHMALDEEGTTFRHTFTVPGEYVYVCTPHDHTMIGIVRVDPCVGHTVAVGPGGEPEFDPVDLEVGLGDTIEWAFESPDHNVTSHPDASAETAVPEDADPFASYELPAENADEIDHDVVREEGETFVHTVTAPGDYEYVCTRHEDVNMSGTITVTDDPDAEVAVGPNGDNAFDPDELTVEVGDVVRWTFESDGHNVTGHPDAAEETMLPEGADPFASYPVDDDPDEIDHDAVRDETDSFDHQFRVLGTYEYICTRHEGMTASIDVVPCGELAAEDEDPDADEAIDSPDDADVIVGPDGAWEFEPEELEINVGDTVTWYFESPGHNVTSHPDASDRNENPDDAEPFTSYEGDNHMAVDEEGTTFSHTFDVPGEYAYVCTPHDETMVGRIYVSE